MATHHLNSAVGDRRSFTSSHRGDSGDRDYEKHGDKDLEHGQTTAPAQNQASFHGKTDPFGDESNSKVKYKVLKWWQAGFIMIAETISLGVLSLPSVLAAIGFAPGMILIFAMGVIATYTGYTLGQFKLAHPWVHNMADAGEVLFAPLGMRAFGRELFGIAQILFYVFIMGSHVLTFSVMLNTLTGHSTCTIVFAVVGAIICFIFTLPRRLVSVSWMAIASSISVLIAVIITMVGVGVVKPGIDTVVAAHQTTFAKGFLAVTDIIFAYSGHCAWFSFISEFRDPREFPKALYLLQIVDTALYLLAAAVIYAFAGADVASPALGSASKTVAKVAYGIAIPTIIIAGVINGHVAAKYVYVRIFRGTGVMSERSVRGYGSWALIVFTLWLVAWIIAEAIPVFNDLLGIISSAFASWFTYGLGGIFWLFINKGSYSRSGRSKILFVINVLITLLGAVIMVCGLYASIASIISDAAEGTSSFSCANNAKITP